MLKIVNVDKRLSQIEVVVELDSNKISKIYEEIYLRLQQSNSYKGFKKGEAPLDVVRSNTTDVDLVHQSLDALIHAASLEAMDEIKGNKLISGPFYNLINIVLGKFEVQLIYPMFPEFNISDYKNLSTKFINPVFDINDLLKKEKEQIIMRNAVLVDSDEGVVFSGSTISVDMESDISQYGVKENKLKNIPINIGSGQFNKDFEDKLIGKEIGVEHEISIKMPDDHYIIPVRGNIVIYKVKINSIKRLDKPSFDDELVKKLDFKGLTTVGEFDKWAIDTITKREIQNAKNKFYSLAFNEIRKSSQIVFSPELVKANAIREVREFSERLAKNKMNADEWLKAHNKTRESFIEENMNLVSERMVNAAIFSIIAEKENISNTDDEIEKEMENIKNSQPDQNFDMKLINKDVVSLSLTNKKVVDLLIKFNSI